MPIVSISQFSDPAFCIQTALFIERANIVDAYRVSIMHFPGVDNSDLQDAVLGYDSAHFPMRFDVHIGSFSHRRIYI